MADRYTGRGESFSQQISHWAYVKTRKEEKSSDQGLAFLRLLEGLSSLSWDSPDSEGPPSCQVAVTWPRMFLWEARGAERGHPPCSQSQTGPEPPSATGRPPDLGRVLAQSLSVLICKMGLPLWAPDRGMWEDARSWRLQHAGQLVSNRSVALVGLVTIIRIPSRWGPKGTLELSSQTGTGLG